MVWKQGGDFTIWHTVTICKSKNIIVVPSGSRTCVVLRAHVRSMYHKCYIVTACGIHIKGHTWICYWIKRVTAIIYYKRYDRTIISIWTCRWCITHCKYLIHGHTKSGKKNRSKEYSEKMLTMIAFWSFYHELSITLVPHYISGYTAIIL